MSEPLIAVACLWLRGGRLRESDRLCKPVFVEVYAPRTVVLACVCNRIVNVVVGQRPGPGCEFQLGAIRIVEVDGAHEGAW